jgi:hypothetical protein
VSPIPLNAGPGDCLSPDEIRAVRDFVAEHRHSDEPFDLVAGVDTPGDDAARAAAIVRPYVAAGATWWLEPIHELRAEFGDRRTESPTWALEAMRERIRQGPPRV